MAVRFISEKNNGIYAYVEYVFLKFGGHKGAAGLSIEESRIDEFRRRINEDAGLSKDDLTEEIRIDVDLTPAQVTLSLVDSLELLEPFGTPEPYEAVLREINERDEQDMHRAIAPLREAADAIRLDTSALNFDESEQALLKLIQEKLQ